MPQGSLSSRQRRLEVLVAGNLSESVGELNLNNVRSRLNYLFLSVLINEYAKKYAADTDYRIKKSVNTDVGRIRVENILSYNRCNKVYYGRSE